MCVVINFELRLLLCHVLALGTNTYCLGLAQSWSSYTRYTFECEGHCKCIHLHLLWQINYQWRNVLILCNIYKKSPQWLNWILILWSHNVHYFDVHSSSLLEYHMETGNLGKIQDTKIGVIIIWWTQSKFLCCRYKLVQTWLNYMMLVRVGT